MARKSKPSAEARLGAPADAGVQVQRLIVLLEQFIDDLEERFAEILRTKDRSGQGDLVDDMGRAAQLAEKLTLAFARFRKSEKEWVDNMSVEEQMDAARQAILKLYKDRPEFVLDWLRKTYEAVNSARETLLAAQGAVVIPTPRSASESVQTLDPDLDGWAPLD
jgi:hypothetical protein